MPVAGGAIPAARRDSLAIGPVACPRRSVAIESARRSTDPQPCFAATARRGQAAQITVAEWCWWNFEFLAAFLRLEEGGPCSLKLSMASMASAVTTV
jgi:hypothetical protein